MQPTTISMRAVGAAVALVGLAVAGPAARAGEIGGAGKPGLEAVQGVWLEESGRGAIEITSCGEGICGRLVWIKAEGEAAAVKPARSQARSAKAPAKADVACGQQIIGDVKPVEPGTWDGGWIYSPELHARFDVEVKPINHDSLQVTGYDGSKDASQRMVWTRAPADISRCAPKPELAAAAGSVAAAAVVAPVAKHIAAGSSEGDHHGRRASAARAGTKQAHVRSAGRGVHERKPRREVATRTGHGAHCNVKAPFVDVSFRCSSKASRILARLF